MPQAIPAALLFFTSAGLTGAALTVATYVGAALITVAPIGISLLFGARAAVPGVKPSHAQQEVRQPLAPRRKSYGRVRVSGVVWWLDTDPSGSNGRNLYLGMTINHGRIGSIVSYHIDENEVEIDVTGQVITSPYDAKTTILETRLGLPTETAYASLLTEFGVADVRGDGVASILGLFRNWNDATEQMENYPGGLPQLRLTVEASVCFDPREAGYA